MASNNNDENAEGNSQTIHSLSSSNISVISECDDKPEFDVDTTSNPQDDRKTTSAASSKNDSCTTQHEYSKRLTSHRSSAELEADYTALHSFLTEALSERDDLEYQIIELRRQVNDLQNQLDSKDAEWFERLKKSNEIIARQRTLSKTTSRKRSGSRLALRRRHSAAIEESPLEDEIKQAGFETDMLRAIVEPMEVEISRLRRQIENIDTAQKDKTTHDADIQSRYSQEKALNRDLREQLRAVTTQRNVLVTEVERLKLELQREESEHSALKLTYKLANETFLAEQEALQEKIQSAKQQSRDQNLTEENSLSPLEEQRIQNITHISAMNEELNTLKHHFAERYEAQSSEFERRCAHYKATISKQLMEITKMKAQLKQLQEHSTRDTSLDRTALVRNYESQLMSYQLEIAHWRKKLNHAKEDADTILQACIEERLTDARRYQHNLKQSADLIRSEIQAKIRKRVESLEENVHHEITTIPQKLAIIEREHESIAEQVSEMSGMVNEIRISKNSELSRLQKRLDEYDKLLRLKADETDLLSSKLFERDKFISELQAKQQLICTEMKELKTHRLEAALDKKKKMGIHDLSKVIGDYASHAVKETEMKNLFGRKVAIDASMSIYQFLIAVRSEGNNLTNDEGETTSHLSGLFYRTIRMVTNGVKPVYVFDGKPPTLKSGELAKRSERRKEAQTKLERATEEGVQEDMEKFTRRLVKVTPEHNQQCQELLKLMGIPFIVAPCEAESQCAELVKGGKVYATATEDMDALTFGTTILLRHMTFSEARKMPIQQYELSKVLSGLELTYDEFIDLCILLGCDYCDKIGGIGRMRAFSLIKEHHCIENILKAIEKEKKKYSVPDDWKFAEARELFKSPEVTSADTFDFKWNVPDTDQLVDFLCNKHGFEEGRVRRGAEKLAKARNTSTQGRLDSFFSVLPSAPKRPKKGEDKKAASKKGKTSKSKAKARK